MILQENYTLSNGVQIPRLGLGTWFISNEVVPKAVRQAVEIGYRHIDTAQAYQNESGVGEGVRTSGLDRQELFVTTKLAAEIKTYQEAGASIDGSLKRLGLDYIDLMIIHSPKPWSEYQGINPYSEGNREAWRALEDACRAGKLRAIGLSNFEQEDIANILGSCFIRPMVNQVLAHISNTPAELIRYCQDHNLLVEAYSPIGHGELLKNPELARMADKYSVSIPQLGIRYDLQLGMLPLPKTANPDHMRNNAAVDFVISDEDMEMLKAMPRIQNYGEASVFPVYAG